MFNIMELTTLKGKEDSIPCLTLSYVLNQISDGKDRYFSLCVYNTLS